MAKKVKGSSMTIADAIVATSVAHPELGLMETSCVSYEVPGVTAANTTLHGTFNPEAPLVLGEGAEALSESCNARYGSGFGAPFKLDETVKPAISVLPDAEHNNRGWLGSEEEGFAIPSSETLVKLELSADYSLTPTDKTDLQACSKFEELVVKALNSGLEIGQSVGIERPIPNTPPAVAVAPTVVAKETVSISPIPNRVQFALMHLKGMKVGAVMKAQRITLLNEILNWAENVKGTV